MKNLLVVAGEASGDLSGAALVRELRARGADFPIWGVGGDRMKGEGTELLYSLSEFSVLGFSEVVSRIPFFLGALARMRKEIERRRPSAAVLIDFPGFNLRLARSCRKESVPVVYYVSPQVWAWGFGRVRALRELARLVLVILPFEEPLYRENGVPVRFVGHPLVDLARASIEPAVFRERRRILDSRTIVGLFPGSRAQEVERLLPVMTRTVRALREEGFDIAPIIGAAPTLPDEAYREGRGAGLELVRGETYNLLAASAFALVASGTMTVEAACIGTPMAILYRVSPLSWMIGKRLVRVPHIGMVNLLAGERLAPEFLQGDATHEKILPVVREWLRRPESLERMRGRLREVREGLGAPGASGRAAEAVLEILG
jgi:lipid-A-disaccharide synthase